jgi:hypothetical protein
MQYLLSTDEIQAMYKKLEAAKEPDSKDMKQSDKTPYLSQRVQKALELVSY